MHRRRTSRGVTFRANAERGGRRGEFYRCLDTALSIMRSARQQPLKSG